MKDSELRHNAIDDLFGEQFTPQMGFFGLCVIITGLVLTKILIHFLWNQIYQS